MWHKREEEHTLLCLYYRFVGIHSINIMFTIILTGNVPILLQCRSYYVSVNWMHEINVHHSIKIIHLICRRYNSMIVLTYCAPYVTNKKKHENFTFALEKVLALHILLKFTLKIWLVLFSLKRLDIAFTHFRFNAMNN